MRRSKSERLAHLEAWRSSGLSRPEYCKEKGLKYATFMSWFKIETTNTEVPGQFVKLPESLPIPESTIIFPNGIRLHYTGELTPELIQVLQNA